MTRPPVYGESVNRIVIPIEIEGNQTEAIVDTGGIHFICSSELAEVLDVDPTNGLGPFLIHTVRGQVRGTLHLLNLRLVATVGESLDVVVTAVIPDADYSWTLPSYMGYQGCLDRFRFAIDSENDLFYFGGGHLP